MKHLLIALSAIASMSELSKAPAASAPRIIEALQTPAAPYPQRLVRSCVGGRVTFRFSVGESGRVVEFTQEVSPHPELSAAVEQTVRKHWLFKPFPAVPGASPVWIRSYMNFEPECTEVPPNNSSKPTPLRGAA